MFIPCTYQATATQAEGERDAALAERDTLAQALATAKDHVSTVEAELESLK
ncbi:hypothetical protein SARC_16717, partial [Sphaeroforma arctica JP610]